MGEEYTGVKFKTIFLNKNPPNHENLSELIWWCNKFSKLGLSPSYGQGSGGNLSFRTDDGFIITGTKTFLDKITLNEFVKVVDCDMDKKEVTVVGLVEPSSEAILHSAIYKKRTDVQAIFHAHSKTILDYSVELGLLETAEEKPYGSIELIEEVLKVVDLGNFVIMKNHGFLSFGKTMNEAGTQVLDKLNEIKQKK